MNSVKYARVNTNVHQINHRLKDYESKICPGPFDADCSRFDLIFSINKPNTYMYISIEKLDLFVSIYRKRKSKFIIHYTVDNSPKHFASTVIPRKVTL